MTSNKPKNVQKLAKDKYIYNNKGQIQLQFMVKGHAYRWSKIGPIDDEISVSLANEICAKIRLAIKLGTFTGVAADYVPSYRTTKPSDNKIALLPGAKVELDLLEVWEVYKDAKISSLQPTTVETDWLRVDKLLIKLDDNDLLPCNAHQLVSKMLQFYAIGSLVNILATLTAASNYCYKNDLIAKSYWSNLKHSLPTKSISLRVANEDTAIIDERGRIKCFSQDEINAILEAFKNNTYSDKNSIYKDDFYYNYSNRQDG